MIRVKAQKLRQYLCHEFTIGNVGYSIFGLLPALLICGAIAGTFVPVNLAGSGVWLSKLEIKVSVVAALVPLGGLSILDKIIGPW